MSAVMGKDGFIKIGADKIAYIDNYSISLTNNIVELPELGKKFINREYTTSDASGSFSGTLDLLDPAQMGIYSMFLVDGTLAKMDLHLGLDSTSELNGSTVASSVDLGVNYNDKVTFSCSFSADGGFKKQAPVV
jgi:hypothetical protein